MTDRNNSAVKRLEDKHHQQQIVWPASDAVFWQLTWQRGLMHRCTFHNNKQVSVLGDASSAVDAVQGRSKSLFRVIQFDRQQIEFNVTPEI